MQLFIIHAFDIQPIVVQPNPPLGVEVIWEFKEFQESKFHKVISKDENASRKSKDERCSIVVHSLCFELNLLTSW